MMYSDENLMRSIEGLFQKIRQQNADDERRSMPPRREDILSRRGVLRDGREVDIRQQGVDDERRGMPPRHEDVLSRRGILRDGREGDIRRSNRPFLARERVLRLLNEDEAISQVKLASYLAIRPQSLSELLAKLEKDGYILRTKNEKDKREILISLTPEGKIRSSEVQKARSGQLESFLSPLTQEEREELFHLIEKIIGNSMDR